MTVLLRLITIKNKNFVVKFLRVTAGHRQYKKKCWEERVSLEILLDLDRIQH